MKRWNILYENCRLPIRIVVFGWILLAIGNLLLNENVNIFYSITNQGVIMFAKVILQIGHIIIVNIPLIFLIGLTAKRANSGAPAIMAVVGYVTYLVVLMFLGPNDLVSQAYTNNLGISYSTQIQNTTTTIYPLQTGIIGSFLVAIITRYSYLHSRQRSIYSILGFADKDTAGLIYNMVLCGLLGVAMSFVWPLIVGELLRIIVWIAQDISDPFRLFVYGILDRTSSILGVGSLVRYPFWFGVEGGTYASIAGQTVIGDVNIWKEMPGAMASFTGAGRFITPYYIINFFICPAIYIALYFSNSNKKTRHRMIMFTIGAVLLSVVCGNPLPLELYLLFTAPLLLAIHILLSGGLFGILYLNNAFMGFNYSGSTISAMPGSFPDFIINVRNPLYIHSILVILIVGIIMAIVYYVVTRVYFEYLSYDVIGSNRSTIIAQKVIAAVGGEDNIISLSSSPSSLDINIDNLEIVSYELLKQVGAWRVTETRDELILSFGSSSTIIKKKIEKIIKASKRQG